MFASRSRPNYVPLDVNPSPHCEKGTLFFLHIIDLVNFWSRTFHFKWYFFHACAEVETRCLTWIALTIWSASAVPSFPFILGYCIGLHIHVILLSSKLTSLTTKALLSIKLWLTRGCLNMHHFTHVCVCTNSQLIHTDTSVQRPLSPLGTATFLHFSRFSQSSALPSHAAIKRGEIFQALTTWIAATTLTNYISIQLRSVCTQFYWSTWSPQLQYHSGSVTLLRDGGPVATWAPI